MCPISYPSIFPTLLTIVCLPPALNCPPEHLLNIQTIEILVIMQVQNKVLTCPPHDLIAYLFPNKPFAVLTPLHCT